MAKSSGNNQPPKPTPPKTPTGNSGTRGDDGKRIVKK